MAFTLDSLTVDLDPVLDGQMSIATGFFASQDADTLSVFFNGDFRPVGSKGSLTVIVKDPAGTQVGKKTFHGDLNAEVGASSNDYFAVINGVSTNCHLHDVPSAGATGQYTVEFMVAGKLPDMRVGVAIGASSITYAELSGRGPHGATLKVTKA